MFHHKETSNNLMKLTSKVWNQKDFSRKKDNTVQILNCEGLVTWMLSSFELSDQIMFPFTTSFEGSTYINFGLLVRISWTFLLVSFCNFFTIEIMRTDSPGSKNCCLFSWLIDKSIYILHVWPTNILRTEQIISSSLQLKEFAHKRITN